MNICSCIVHTHRGAGHEVMPRLKAMPGVDVHAGAEADKLIVTIEDTEQAMAADTVGALTRVPGVINAVLIYHYGGDDLGEDGAEAQAVA